MAFPIGWKYLQPSSCMGMQHHTNPLEYSSLSTNESTLGLQCHTSPQESVSVSTNNTLECFSYGLLQDYEQLHDRIPFGSCSSLSEWIAFEAQSQLLKSNNIERSNIIEWLDQTHNYECKGSQESTINSSSTISSTTLSASRLFIDQFHKFNNDNQALSSCIGDYSPTLSNHLHNTPLIIEPKPLDLHLLEQDLAMHYNVGDQMAQMMEPKPLDLGLIEQEMAMYDNVGDQKPLVVEPKPLDFGLFEQELAMYNNLKSLVQGDNMSSSTSSLCCDGASSIIKPSGVGESNIINTPYTFNNRGDIFNSNIAHNILASMSRREHLLEERENVVKREERENATDERGAVMGCNMFGFSCVRQANGVRREKKCREEGTEGIRERRGARRREIGDERELAIEEQMCIVDEREGVYRNNGGLQMREVRREKEGLREQGRKRARDNGGVCKRRYINEGEEDVIHVRARRGQATDSHSLAERVRRQRINQRMKLLQDLVPSCTQVLGKAAVLEEIINYVKSLQQQIEFLSMRLANTHYQKKFHI